MINAYILKVSQLNDLDSIVYHVSQCLQELFHYRVLAFAMYDRDFNGGIDVWADPSVASSPLLAYIRGAFEPSGLNCNIRTLDAFSRRGGLSSRDDLDRVLTIKVIDGATRARLYLHTARKLGAYNAELTGIIVKTLATAIVNFMNVKKLEHASLRDSLTHCYNRRALTERMRHDIAYADRYGSDLSVVMFDIDHFKRVNDVYGHSGGDAVLGGVAKGVLGAIRESDYMARYGGEEFVLVLPGTPLSKAIETAERLRKNIENLQTAVGKAKISVTASFGVAEYRRGIDQETLIKRADRMLYEAKNLGRNRIQPAPAGNRSPTAAASEAALHNARLRHLRLSLQCGAPQLVRHGENIRTMPVQADTTRSRVEPALTVSPEGSVTLCRQAQG